MVENVAFPRARPQPFPELVRGHLGDMNTQFPSPHLTSPIVRYSQQSHVPLHPMVLGGHVLLSTPELAQNRGPLTTAGDASGGVL